MRLRFLLTALLLVELTSSLFAQVQSNSVKSFKTKQPARFAENKGQITDQDGKLRTDVKYIYNSPGFKATFKANSFSYEVYTLVKKPKQISEAKGKPDANLIPDKFKQSEDVAVNSHRIDINLSGANQYPEILVEGKSADYNNYYLAHTPELGVQKVYSYTKLTYKNIWPKVDIVFYAKKEGELKYDIVVHPGGKLSDVKFIYNGSNRLMATGKSLRITTFSHHLQETIPASYLKESNQSVDVCYRVVNNTLSFKAAYNKRNTLIIDPLLVYATYYGGTSWDEAGIVDNDSAGNVFLAGTTRSHDNISTTGSYQSEISGGPDAFITKFDSNGIRLWGTYYGGKLSEEPQKIVVYDLNSIYVVGNAQCLWTDSSCNTLLGTTGAHQTRKGGLTDAFLVKFDSTGQRTWGTYYGGKGMDFCYGLTSDLHGNIFITGETRSTDHIASPGAHDSILDTGVYIDNEAYVDIFLVKFDSSGRRKWGTYIGGTGGEHGIDLVTDTVGNVFVTGATNSISSIATPGAHQPELAYGSDAYLIKFDSLGRRVWGTYFGSSEGEGASTVEIDNAGNLYIGGLTSSFDGIASKESFQDTINKGPDWTFRDCFLVKFDSSGKRLWSTYYGGDFYETISSMEVDVYNRVYIFGGTNSSTGIASNDAYQKRKSQDYDAFLAVFDSSGNRFWGSYFGSVRFDYGNSISIDTSGKLYLAGTTSSHDNISYNAFQPTIGGVNDLFLIKMNSPLPKPKPEPSSINNKSSGDYGISIYPNPFENRVVVDYSLKHESHVGFTLYGLNGRIEAQLQTTKKSIGKHQFILDAEKYNLSVGVYILKLEVDGVPTYKRIVKTK